MTLMPSTLDIVGKKYAVIKYTRLSDTADVGRSDAQEQELRVALGTHPQHERDTLLHEAIHAIDAQLGIGLSERQVIALAAGMYYLLTRNPSMVSYVQGA